MGGDPLHGTSIQFYKDVNAPYMRKLLSRNPHIRQSNSVREHKGNEEQTLLQKLLQEDEESDDETKLVIKEKP